jgi:Fur family iron response transcriptional regulator
MLYEEATLAKVTVSNATIYNTLNQLTDAGLLRQVAVDGTKTYFDTNTTAHHHFYLEHNHELIDIPDSGLALHRMPDVPEGYEIPRIDMVVRLRKKS